MNRRGVYTIVGIMLSFCLVFGGWFLTESLLNNMEKELLSGDGAVQIDRKETIADNQASEVDTSDNGKTNHDFNSAELTTTEMVKILQNWESDTNEFPHEPMEGQMSMEQAINTGKDWIAGLGEEGLISSELYEDGFEKISATLNVKQEKDQEKRIDYSYWKVSFTNNEMKVDLMIQASTGQVWDAMIYFQYPEIGLKKKITEQILNSIFPYLPSNDDKQFQENINTACNSYDGAKLYAAVTKGGLIGKLTKGNEVTYLVFHIYLSTQSPIN